jgi:DNA-binding CsgD family transcriptional regulator
MYWSKCWEVFYQTNQGICVFNCKLENVYANEKAKRVLENGAPELCQQIKGICRRFMAMVRAKETSLVNYSGMLKHRRTVIIFSCFSFYLEEQAFTIITFDYGASGESGSAGEVTFTPREKDILQAIADGKTNKEISEFLCISFETVKSHVRNLLAKTGTSSRTELISKYCHLDNYTVGKPNYAAFRKK